MSESPKSFTDTVVDLLLKGLRIVFNERVVGGVERGINYVRESLKQNPEETPSDLPLANIKAGARTSLPWMLTPEEKVKYATNSILTESASMQSLADSNSIDVDLEAMKVKVESGLRITVVISAKALEFLRNKASKLSKYLEERKAAREQEKLIVASKKETLPATKEVDLKAVEVEKAFIAQESVSVKEVIEPKKPEVAPIVEEKLEPKAVLPERPASPAPIPMAKVSKPARAKKIINSPQEEVVIKSARNKRSFANLFKSKIVLVLILVALLGAVAFGLSKTVFSNQSSPEVSITESTPVETEGETDESTEESINYENQGSYDVGAVSSDDFSNFSTANKIAYSTFFYTPSLSNEQILEVINQVERGFRNCLAMQRAKPENCPIAETDVLNIRSIKWKWIQSTKIQFVETENEILYAEMEYAALNSGTHLQNGKLRKFVNADSGNKVIGVKVVGSKVQIIW